MKFPLVLPDVRIDNIGPLALMRSVGLFSRLLRAMMKRNFAASLRLVYQIADVHTNIEDVVDKAEFQILVYEVVNLVKSVTDGDDENFDEEVGPVMSGGVLVEQGDSPRARHSWDAVASATMPYMTPHNWRTDSESNLAETVVRHDPAPAGARPRTADAVRQGIVEGLGQPTGRDADLRTDPTA